MMNINYYKTNQAFELEGGEILPSLTMAYHTFGTLNADASNVVWVIHALTADSNCVDWWNGLFGNDGIFNTENWYIICVNNLGSCYGSTGALNIEDDRFQFQKFPNLTIRDMANALEIVQQQLQLPIHTLIGGSMGGQIAQEWIMKGVQVHQTILLATNARHSAWGIAFNETQRMAILADETYYSGTKKGGKAGLKVARAIALLSYRNYQAYLLTQTDTLDVLDKFKASTYQNYQGEKLCKRFDAYSYLCLCKAMDTHNIFRGDRSFNNWANTKTLVISINSDILFPNNEQLHLANITGGAHVIIDSKFGHDGFLIETDKINLVIEKFMNNNYTKNKN